MEKRDIPVTGEKYLHFKNKLYQIVTTAMHSETGECMVVYQALYGDYGVYVRPLELFMSEVDHEKYPEVTQKYRFEKVECTGQTGEGQPQPQVWEGQVQRQPQAREGQPQPQPQAGEVQMQQPQAGTELLINFLDAEAYAEKLNILRGMKKYIDDKMAHDMAVSLDIVLKEEPLEEKIKDLESCLKTYARFECRRFRG